MCFISKIFSCKHKQLEFTYTHYHTISWSIFIEKKPIWKPFFKLQIKLKKLNRPDRIVCRGEFSFESLMMNYYHYPRSEMSARFRPIEIKLDFELILYYYLSGVINRARLFDERVFIFWRKVSKINEANERSSFVYKFRRFTARVTRDGK